jgi:hypothetical protein
LSLKSNLEVAFVRVATEFKNLRTLISGTATGDVSGLTTTATNLVGAINEVRDTAGSAVTSVNGVAGPGAVTVSTSDVAEGTNLYFTNARAIAAPLAGYASGAGVVSATDSVLQAIQKLNGNASALINDAAASTTTVYSSSRTDSQIATAVTNLINSSPAALDTLAELASSLGTDSNFSTTIMNALALKANSADVYTRTDLGVGVHTTDYEAVFVTALA